MTNSHDEGTGVSCSGCGEVAEPGFRACWRCGADLPGFQSKSVEASAESKPDATPVGDENLPMAWMLDADPLSAAGRATYEQGKGVLLAWINYAKLAWLGLVFIPLLGIVLVPIALLTHQLMTGAARGKRAGPSSLSVVQVLAIVHASFIGLIAFMFVAQLSETPGPYTHAGEQLMALPPLAFAILAIICEVRIASLASLLKDAVTLADQS
jgi:hypothetical protein